MQKRVIFYPNCINGLTDILMPLDQALLRRELGQDGELPVFLQPASKLPVPASRRSATEVMVYHIDPLSKKADHNFTLHTFFLMELV
jgi:hypothetical protein